MLRAKEGWAGQATEGHWFLSNVRSMLRRELFPKAMGSRGLVTHSEFFQL